MSFQQYLQQLIGSIDGAEGAVMAAYDGEPVTEALSASATELEMKNSGFVDNRLDRYGLQVLGAHLRGMLNILDRVHERVKIVHADTVSIRGMKRSFFIQNLNDRYYILLVIRNGPGLVGAEQKLRSYAAIFNREM